MSGKKKTTNRFDEQDLPRREPEVKVGLVATVNPKGLPHITLITTLQARTPCELMWGEFSEGLSKQHVLGNPRTGFLILTPSMDLWRGKALWTRRETSGEDYSLFNRKPMFRYNAYFGIHAVHRMDLVETFGRERLPIMKIILSSLMTKMAESSVRKGDARSVLNPWAVHLFNKPGTLKFLCFIDGDGFPVLIPLIQCRAADGAVLVFSRGAYREELARLEKGRIVAVFGLGMDREDVLVRGVFETHQRTNLGTAAVNWVYNSMPPLPGQIYPEQELKTVMDFS